MPPLVGEPTTSPFTGADWVGDVAWFDGPLASIYRDDRGPLYAHWCDQGPDANRWAVVRLTPERLRDLGDGKVSMRDLLTAHDGDAWLVDLDTHGDPLPNGCVRVAAFPEEYLPTEHSIHPRTEWTHLDPGAWTAAGLAW